MSTLSKRQARDAVASWIAETRDAITAYEEGDMGELETFNYIMSRALKITPIPLILRGATSSPQP